MSTSISKSLAHKNLHTAIVLFTLLALGVTASAQEHPIAKSDSDGATTYRNRCAECHGDKGQGVKDKYDEPLIGNKTLAALTRYITRTMPEGEEGTCVGKEAEGVAGYIFESFYSQAAQLRNAPVTIGLARLTAQQYQQSVADLVNRVRGGFSFPNTKDHGLKGEYRGKKIAVKEPEPPATPTPAPAVATPVPAAPAAGVVDKAIVDKEIEKNKAKEKETEIAKAKERERAKRKAESHRFDRIDGRVSFQFGAGAPDPAMQTEEFSASWRGSIVPTDTGWHDFIIRTENGARLFVNDNENPLIDAWVSAGATVREEKGRIYLLEGRAYPISLDFFKFRDKTASIELLWKPPHGMREIIPAHAMRPQGTRDTLLVTVNFPADDSSEGYASGKTISKEWDQATTQGALQMAALIDGRLDSLAGTKPDAADRVEKLKQFATRLLEAAFRRPLTDEEKTGFIQQQFEKSPQPEIAVKRLVLFALKSPRFLYPEIVVPGKRDGFAVASRLALALWDSMPDEPLHQAAARGQLETRDQIASQARRMVTDPRAKAKLRGFFHHWLELDRADNASKDSSVYPEFNDSMRAELRESLWRFVEEVVWSDSSDYRQLLTADHIWLSPKLAAYYGKKVSTDFEKVHFDPAQRAGVITHPYLLSSLAYSRQSSPIHRGVFLSRNIAGLALKNPSVAVAFEDAKFDPTLTMREKVSQLTKNASCMGCHSVINPWGFSLEHFDAVGRWRTVDNSKPINAVAEFETDDGRNVKLTGPRDVANYAVASESSHRAFVRHLFHHAVKQPVPAFGGDTLDKLRVSFSSNGFHIQKLLAEIAVTAALAEPQAPSQKLAQTP